MIEQWFKEHSLMKDVELFNGGRVELPPDLDELAPEGGRVGPPPDRDELAREGARRMIAAALRAEADGYVERFAGERDGEGHRLVRQKGRGKERRGGGGGGATAP